MIKFDLVGEDGVVKVKVLIEENFLCFLLVVEVVEGMVDFCVIFGLNVVVEDDLDSCLSYYEDYYYYYDYDDDYDYDYYY